MTTRTENLICFSHNLLKLFVIAIICGGSLLWCQNVCAEDLRIATKVTTEENKEKVLLSESATLFKDGVAYDFLSHPDHIAIYRQTKGGKEGVFILLSPEHEIQTEITTSQIEGVLKKLQDWAAGQEDPALQFSAVPRFHEVFNKKTQELVLSSSFQTYRVQTAEVPKGKDVTLYRSYLTWYTRLNAMLHGGMSPQPRMKLNIALKAHNALPKSVELTKPTSKSPIRAEHTFLWRLSKRDLRRIDEAGRQMADYHFVTNQEFQRITSGPSLSSKK